MTGSFSLGINKAWGGLDTVQAPGFYWLNLDRQRDAEQFCRQIMSALPADVPAALICQAVLSKPLLSELKQAMVNKIPLFTLSAAAVLHLTTDLTRSLSTNKRLFILLTTSSLWQNFTKDERQNWMKTTSTWLNDRHSTFLVINHGPGTEELNQQLLAQYRCLDGLSYVKWQQEQSEQLISWWATEQGLIANQTLHRPCNEQTMQAEPLPESPLAAQDEFLALADLPLKVTHKQHADEKISALEADASAAISPIAAKRTVPVNITLSTGQEAGQKSN